MTIEAHSDCGRRAATARGAAGNSRSSGISGDSGVSGDSGNAAAATDGEVSGIGGSSSAAGNSGVLLAAVALAQLLIGLDYNIVFVALPDMTGVGLDGGNRQWVVSGYALAFGGFLLLSGRLADQWGRRRMFLTGLALFAAGSAIGGLANGSAMLIAGRVVQGLGGAALAPATLAILTVGFPQGAARNRALGIWGMTGSAGMVLGSVLGGLLTQWWGWRAVFFVNLPLVAMVVLLGLRGIRRDTGAQRRAGVDLPGAVLSTGAALALVLGGTLAGGEGSAPAAAGMLMLAVLLGAAFLVVERRSAHPLVPLSRFRNTYLSVGVGSTLLFMAGFGAVAYFLTDYFQRVRELSPVVTGLAFVVPCVAVLIGTNLSGRLIARYGLRATLVAGNLVGALGMLALALVVTTDAPWLLVLPVTAVFSLGQGVVFTAMFATATTDTTDAEQGVASGIATTGQQFGAALGLALLVWLATGAALPLRPAALAITVLILLGAVLALALPPRRAGGQ
ncbi:MFS transporter [Nakamurella aerolata]|uniref:MFS transporter n=1 Tax=Nakamurella aerolata TaxID=1656892 RepID=A0A849A4C5_9ACTN|nr:MFS transporter [Nakamurella aerolata]NNG35405.1 MFS transporter [Nakamurella aerolata]